MNQKYTELLWFVVILDLIQVYASLVKDVDNRITTLAKLVNHEINILIILKKNIIYVDI